MAFGGAQAFAADGEHPRLVQVTGDSKAAIHHLETQFDVGYISADTEAAVYVTNAEEAQLRALGYRIGETIEDRGTWEARKAEIAATKEAEALASRFAQRGLSKSGVEHKGKQIVPVPGETVIMRAYTFTNYAGRFLYVEAHNKANTNTSGPTQAVSYAGPGGVYSTPQNMFKFNDAGQYMYHRQLVALSGDFATIPTEDLTVRVAAASGATDTSTPIEWAGSGMPPRVPEFQKDFITKYMDPTEVYDRIDDIAEQYPDIAEIVPLPHDSHGYQRPGMAMMAGTTAPGSNPAGPTNQNAAVQLFSKAMGHEGGNLISAEFRNPSAPGSPLSVSVDGMGITVSLATDASGALTSTANDVIAAINGNAGASALVTAYRYQTAAGTGIVQPRERVQLSDFLDAPAHVQRGPFDMRMLRIGKQRDGSKTGVFIYCQQHAREWVTPITCLETAERLVRNYATDPTTKSYVDNLDIFIIPSVNPDGGHASFYDLPAQRKNMHNHCLPEATGGAVGNRESSSGNHWGVDLNRNNTVGSVFDGYVGADSGCSQQTYSGPFEASENEIKNELWVVDTFPKIKFAINIHTHGGYFMWAPGAYKSAGRETLPAPNIGIEKYFFDVSETILSHIKSSRGTVIPPDRTGPIADVLYSAAGNSADDQWYRRGIISYSFEAGAERFSVNPTTGAINRRSVGFQPCFGGPGTHGPFANPSERCGTVEAPDPLMVNEGHDSTMEFADGNYGLLQGALEYTQDVTAPGVDIEYSAAQTAGEPINYRFKWVNESAVIHYTTDGSAPTTNSPMYQSQGTRRPGQVLTITRTGVHDVKWIAVDIKGNVSQVKTQRFLVGATDVGGSVPATLSLSLGTPASFGAFVPGIANDYTASTTASVISTAGDGRLSVADASSTNTGHLVNGKFFLPQKLQASATSLSGTGGAFAQVGGSATPTQLLTYSGPVSNDSVTLNFKQAVGANDALRTGAYAKTLTFTLSTTTP